jgi:hypothetical protein
MRIALTLFCVMFSSGCGHWYFKYWNHSDVTSVRRVPYPIPTSPPSAEFALVSLRNRYGYSHPMFPALKSDYDDALKSWGRFAAKCRSSDLMIEVEKHESVTYVIEREGQQIAALSIPYGGRWGWQEIWDISGAKRPNKAPEPTTGTITPRAAVVFSSSARPAGARGAPVPVVAHL